MLKANVSTCSPNILEFIKRPNLVKKSLYFLAEGCLELLIF